MTTFIGDVQGARKKGRERPRLSTRRRRSPSLKIKRAKPLWPAFSLSAVFAEQRDRVILWVPIAMMAGAVIYFSAPVPPAAWLGPAIVVSGALMGFAAAAWPVREGFAAGLRVTLFCAALGAAALGLGLGASAIREAAVAGPKLAREVGPVLVQGWVTDLDRGETRPRLTIRVHTIEGVERPPRLVRISTTDPGAITPGRAVRCRAIVHPPEGPMAPGAYDGAFVAYFAGMGATGFSLGACRPALDLGAPTPADGAWLKAAAVRRAITETILEAAPGRGGAVAAALITGDRSAIDNDTTLIFRNSGLAHLLSVSGFHMSLVAGMIYGAVHVMLALLPGFALRFPIRKWAAAAAIIGAGLYLVLSGLSVPAQRAYVMTAVVLGAILIDRPAITMRGLAVAAFVIMIIAPESVMTPGFQMSFAATAALIAAFEMYQAKRDQGLPTPGLLIASLQSFGRWMAGALLASAVAGFATDPFALAHFQRFSLYALPANLAATPITSLIVTPAAGAAALLAPFGLADPALRVMAWGLDLLVAVGGVFADRPEAIRGLPAPPAMALLLWSLAIAWGCLWRGVLRVLAVALLGAGLALYALSPRPTLYAAGALQAVIARAADEKGAVRWIAANARGASFERERLGQLAGLSERDAQDLAGPERCGETLCVWASPYGRPVGVAYDAASLDALCMPHAIVIAHVAPPPAWAGRCQPDALIDPSTLAREGGAAMYETASAVRVVRARARDQQRSWDGVLTDTGE